MLDLRLTRRSVTLSAAYALTSLKIKPSAAQDPAIYVFAVLGLDTRGQDVSQRSDSIMLSRVDTKANTVRTLSIPRDLYVEIPGYGYGKINDAYQRGLEADPELKWQSGAATAVSALTHNFGVESDGAVVLELQRLPEVVDAVGGIDLENPYHVYVEDFPNFSGGGTRTLDFPAGQIRLDGTATMDFVRTRQQDGDGGRVMRQHLVLAALLEKIQQPEMLTRIPALIEQLRGIVHTDIDLPLQLQLVTMIPKITPEAVTFGNIEPLLWSDYTAEGAWIYQGDWSVLPGYVQSWLNGEIQ